MALIKQAEAQHIAGSAVSLHLGDLRQEGDQIVAESKTRAGAIVAEARTERERLISDASETGYDVGYNKGLAAGLARGQEDGQAEALESTSASLSSMAEAWGVAIAQFERDREKMIAEARTDIVRLAVVFAERVTKRVVELDAGVVEGQIEAVLRTAIKPTRLTISVHPVDAPRAERALPDLLRRLSDNEHAELVTDESLERGSCVARMPSGAVIDASVGTQIDRLVAELLPDGRSDVDEGDGGAA